MTVKNTT